ncbi:MULTISPECIES: TauD/TfdA dioxygenase family protein [Thermomonosporaceae]|uniref:TauD/TfdA dioxygenase family protein n=1 Tax=Thermomonosporaceae TaxID=2012 RepID=UPI00255B1387|nr:MULTISPECIES: TauD/TfdA family dioxygenase [Thermomonosporaceae]MDL4775539.1 TauD/TfdA family dioxygenase [Actinomadura xylanilytica]
MIEFQPMTRNIGAEVTGVELSKPLDPEQVQQIRDGLLEHMVLFFRDQQISDEEHVAFAKQFGTANLPPMDTSGSAVHVLDQTDPKGEGGDQWHSDNTFMRTPPMGSLLRAVILPEVGGDTLWANMYMAYDSLAPWLQRLCDDLYAEHDLTMSVSKAIDKGHRMDLRAMQDDNPPVTHPVVRIHPETGRKALYVNRSSVTRLIGLSRRENEAILPLLFDAVRDPQFQVRLKWRVGTLAFWDNRPTQHYAVADYTERRKMHRVTVNCPAEIDDGIPKGPDGVTGDDAPAEAAAARYL